MINSSTSFLSFIISDVNASQFDQNEVEVLKKSDEKVDDLISQIGVNTLASHELHPNNSEYMPVDVNVSFYSDPYETSLFPELSYLLEQPQKSLQIFNEQEIVNASESEIENNLSLPFSTNVEDKVKNFVDTLYGIKKNESWSVKNSKILIKLIIEHPHENWKWIADMLNERCNTNYSHTNCYHRATKILEKNPKLKNWLIDNKLMHSILEKLMKSDKFKSCKVNVIKQPLFDANYTPVMKLSKIEQLLTKLKFSKKSIWNSELVKNLIWLKLTKTRLTFEEIAAILNQKMNLNLSKSQCQKKWHYLVSQKNILSQLKSLQLN